MACKGLCHSQALRLGAAPVRSSCNPAAYLPVFAGCDFINCEFTGIVGYWCDAAWNRHGAFACLCDKRGVISCLGTVIGVHVASVLLYSANATGFAKATGIRLVLASPSVCQALSKSLPCDAAVSLAVKKVTRPRE